MNYVWGRDIHIWKQYVTDEREMHRAMKKEQERKRPGPFTVTGVQHWLALLKSIYFLSNWTSAQFSQAILADGLVNTLPCVPEEKLQCIMKAKKKRKHILPQHTKFTEITLLYPIEKSCLCSKRQIMFSYIFYCCLCKVNSKCNIIFYDS